MTIPQDAEYPGIAAAIEYLVAQRESQPSLDDTARIAGLSPTHFQRVFKAAVGVSPKRFLQFLTAGDAKAALRDGASVLDAALEAGLSGSSRLHDLLLVTDAMTPGTYRRKGAGLTIHYGVVPGPFGRTMIGATNDGICWLSFTGDSSEAAQMAEMKRDWPAATFECDDAIITPLAHSAFSFAANTPLDRPIGLYVQGTNFQIKVWQALLRIPSGSLVTYGDIAKAIGSPRASRAVGSAVGQNMISLLIPCHRVILASGAVHNYRWGVDKKHALLAAELSPHYT